MINQKAEGAELLKVKTPILVQCATPLEFESLRQAFNVTKIFKENGRTFFEVKSIKDRSDPNLISALILRGGLGKTKAAESLKWALTRWPIGFVLDFGTAGALVESLSIGVLVLSKNLNNRDLKEMNLGRDLVFGPLASVDHDVSTIAQRRQLAAQTGALAVSWETESIFSVCATHNLACGSCRVVSDIGDGDLKQEYSLHAQKVLQPAALWVVKFVECAPIVVPCL